VELNMIQNLEEATYLESIISLLEQVQESKEVAADAYFKLQVKNLKEQKKSKRRREKEVNDAKAKSMLDMAELIAKYIKEEMQDREEEEEKNELVERTERRKDFQASQSKVLLSVSNLYDTILWSVATSSIGLSTTETNSFRTFDDDDYDDDDEECDHDDFGVEENKGNVGTGGEVENYWRDNDTASNLSGSTANTTSGVSQDNLSPVGHIFVKDLRRKISAKEKIMEKRHKAECREEKRRHRIEARKLKEKHQAIVDGILAKCVEERHRLREAISRRMALVEEKQSFSTQSLQEGIESDVSAMQGAWAEHKRLEEEKKSSFAKAQALISAQVFHEVRNALSSVVAMSEMTLSLEKDPTVSPQVLVSSVREMLDQNKEVVDYSLSMLNNILDVSKIKSGSFETREDFFDVQDLVNRATTMQLVKAQTRGVKMSFTPMPEPQIAYSDKDIVSRIITNFIGNAVKFTTVGAVQPFVCPLGSIDPAKNKTKSKSISLEKKDKSSTRKGSKACKKKGPSHAQVKYVAVGVADTGPGLSKELLDIAQEGLYNSDTSTMNSGAKNSGFGLHLAHQLAGTLDSEVNLTHLDAFQDLCNVDMSRVLNNVGTAHIKDSSPVTRSDSSQNLPGKGTVLYITLPVISDIEKVGAISKSTPGSNQELYLSSNKYVFSPHPSPTSVNGCFRILIADDVSMLRKGLMRSVLDIFSGFANCPISVGTACTAEDALRALKSQNYDMFICDNQFDPPSHLSCLSPKSKDERMQFCNRSDSKDKNDIRKSVTEFFAKEAFTTSPGDGSLSGLDALLQLAQRNDSNVPVLIIHSGHQIQLSQKLGIICVRKPLRRIDFVPLLERNAQNLIESGMCVEVKRGNDTIVLNKAGAQLFRKR